MITRKLLIALAATAIFVNAAIWVMVHKEWYLPKECRGAPPVVVYRPGMTLCPHQSAVGSLGGMLVIIDELPKPTHDTDGHDRK